MTLKDVLSRKNFKKCVNFHGHLCPGLSMGYRAATAGLDWLREKRAEDEELVAIVETDACCVDAIQVLTGCTFGKGNLIYKDYGKMVFTFFNRHTGKGVRLAMKPDTFRVNDRQIELFKKTRDGSITEAEREELSNLGFQRTTEILNTRAEDLFGMTPVVTGIPEKARIEPSKPCTRCGEPAMSSKLETVEGALVCRGCLATQE
mgnify:CR=1 FL=1